MVYSNLKLRTLDGDVDFIPTDKQKLLVDIMSTSNVSSRLTRQQGFSTIQTISALDRAVFTKSHILIISHNNSQSIYKLKLLADMVSDSKYRVYITRITKNRIEFTNGSVISISSIQNMSHSLAGQMTPIVYIDVLLNINNIEETIRTVSELICRSIKFSIGLMSNPPQKKKESRKYHESLSELMTMLQYHTIMVDFPNTKKMMVEGLSKEQHNIEYELFPYNNLGYDPTFSDN